MRRRLAGAHRGEAALEFVRRDVLDMRGKVPDMAERVSEGARTVAVELRLDRPEWAGSRCYGPARHCIDVVNEEMQADRPVATRLRPEGAGGSSATMIRDSPISSSAWPTRPPGASRRMRSRAPNAWR
jgi:hypothetical protein